MKMTTKISVVLNLALAGVLIFVWMNSQRPGATSALPAVAKTKPPPPPPAVERQVVAATKPLRWSQLVSTNSYRAYVANLRNFGCPEATVEDIVRGDAQRAFNAKRRELGIDDSQPGPWSAHSQMQLVAYLLGQTPAIAGEPAATGSPPDRHPTESATLAAFLQSADLTTQGLNEEQKQQIASLRQSLRQQISHPNQAPGNLAAPVTQASMNSTQSSVARTESVQGGTVNTQPPQAGTNNTPARWPRKPNQSLVQAAQAESILGGLFGIGAAIQYDQYRLAHAGQPPP